MRFYFIFVLLKCATKTFKKMKTLTFFLTLIVIASGLNAQEAKQESNIITEEEKIRIYEEMQAERDRIYGSGSSYRTPSFDPSLDEVLNVNDFILVGQGPTVSFNIPAGLTSSGNVVGFTFEGTVSGISGNDTWASDMIMTITSPAGEAFEVGGFSSPGDNNWDFQGSTSDSNDTYESEHLLADNGDPVFAPGGTTDEGDWILEFVHDWDSSGAANMDWSDVTITLHKTEPPPVPLNGTYLVFSLLLMTAFVVYRFRM